MVTGLGAKELGPVVVVVVMVEELLLLVPPQAVVNTPIATMTTAAAITGTRRATRSDFTTWSFLSQGIPNWWPGPYTGPP